jgi:tetratricopeptide (TPR) repeat protein
VITGSYPNPAYALGLAASLGASPLRERLLEFAETQSSLTGTRDEYGAAIDEMRGRDSNRRRSEQLGLSKEWQREIARLERVIERFHRSTNKKEYLQAAQALVGKALLLSEVGRHREAIEVYESLLARFADTSDPELREHVVTALINKGFSLREVGERKLAIQIYDDVASHFGDASDPALREAIAQALFNKGLFGRRPRRPRAGDRDLRQHRVALRPCL